MASSRRLPSCADSAMKSSPCTRAARDERDPQLPKKSLSSMPSDGSSNELEVNPSLLGRTGNLRRPRTRDRSVLRKYGWSYLQAATDIPFEDLMLNCCAREGLLR